MPTVVVPFRAGGKSRLPSELREAVALAMLEDTLAVAVEVGPTRLVTGEPAAAQIALRVGATVVPDPGGGQGVAVEAALRGLQGPCLVVNADLPRVTADALRRLAGAGSAFVAAADGTTNALALPDPGRFAPLYGPGSAARFAAAGLAAISIPELERDVDTVADLEGLLDAVPPDVGPLTTLVLSRHGRSAAPTP